VRRVADQCDVLINAISPVDRFNKIDEPASQDFQGQLSASYDLCSFLSQIVPSFDGEFERFYPSRRRDRGKRYSPGNIFETGNNFL
jgi:hypothetical protein